MKKAAVLSLVSCMSLLSACDYFDKSKKEEKAEVISTQDVEWSCTATKNVEEIQNRLKQSYLSEIEKELRHSEYEANLDLLQTINKSIRFEIKGITTLTTEKEQSKTLECSAQVIAHLPQGLMKRAENAFNARPCEECEGDRYVENYTLQDYFDDREFNVKLDQNKVTSALNYQVIQTDQDGVGLLSPSDTDVITGVVYLTKNAVEYEAYIKDNQDIQKNMAEYEAEHTEQQVLAQKAMDIRNKELDSEKANVVERLNDAWEQLTEETRQKFKQDQVEWFEKRDVDCKVLAQKNVYELNESEKETYQKHSSYWNDNMRVQNRNMQYTKCFNQRTKERIVYLNNVE